MSWWDTIQELKESKPDPQKVARILIGIGAFIIIANTIFLAVYRLNPLDPALTHYTSNQLKIMMIAYAIGALIFLLAGLGIKRNKKWGKRLAQLCVVIAPFILAHWGDPNSMPHKDYMFFTSVFCGIIVLFYGPIAYFAIRYLGRLPVVSAVTQPAYTTYESLVVGSALSEKSASEAPLAYSSSPFPFGVLPSFAICLGGFLVVMMTIQSRKPELSPLIFFPLFLLIFITPAIYNQTPSRFQKIRQIVSAFTGGGSLSLFNGSWPFFRMLIYGDGLEVRVFFHSYFIPYDKMAEPPRKAGFLSFGLLIKSELPGVPSRIRFSPFGMKKLLSVLNAQRDKYLAECAGSTSMKI